MKSYHNFGPTVSKFLHKWQEITLFLGQHLNHHLNVFQVNQEKIVK